MSVRRFTEVMTVSRKCSDEEWTSINIGDTYDAGSTSGISLEEDDKFYIQRQHRS